MNKGDRDAGLLMITKEAFEKVGGWNEEIIVLTEKDFYERLKNNNIRQVTTGKVHIGHVCSATRLQDESKYNLQIKHDSILMNK